MIGYEFVMLCSTAYITQPTFDDVFIAILKGIVEGVLAFVMLSGIAVLVPSNAENDPSRPDAPPP
jgi:hypothetical protein